jgi:hypothetical protein
MGMPMTTSSATTENDFVWGGEAIAAELGVTTSQLYYLLKIGALNGAVKKLGHRTLAGSRRKLRALVTAE